MNKYILFILLLTIKISNAQFKNFEISGESKYYDNKELMIESVLTVLNDSGYVEGIKINKSSNYPFNIIKVTNQQFKVYGELKYPIPFEVSYYDVRDSSVVGSQFFFVSQGSTRVNINNLETEPDVLVNEFDDLNVEFNKLNRILGKYKLVSRQIQDNAIVTERQSILKNYIINNPDSFVAMWLLIIDFELNGYNPLIKVNANLLSENLKNIPPLKTLLSKINKTQIIRENDTFPYRLLDFNNNLSEIAKRNRYILIDFWATHCKPCIQQFKILNKLYQDYRGNGFEIVSVAIDSKEKEMKVSKILNQFNIKWTNYNDFDGKTLNNFDANAIPYNILIDKNSKIVKVNISEKDLERLLRE